MLYSMQAFRQAHPLTSFPPIIPESVINEFEYDQIQPSTPPTPKYHEKVERDGVEQSGGKWVEKWKVTDMGKTAMDNSQAANARTDRNRLLTESDWTQLGDITLSEPGALIAFAGKRVIQATVKEELPADFQKSEYVEKCGFVDLIVQRKDLRDKIGSILSILLKKNSDINSLSNETTEDNRSITKVAS